MTAHFNNDWEHYLAPEFEKPYYKELHQKLVHEYRCTHVCPDMYDLFNAFHATSFENVKVVILGQDPYHGRGQAHGLAFSVKPGVVIPPSLQNIYKELEADLGCKPPEHGCLDSWAQQGVLLLNTSLSVREGAANSHHGMGWEILTDHVIQMLNERKEPVVFILWGNNARAKKKLITNPEDLIIESAHPSPLSASRGFFGSRPFSKTNAFLEAHGMEPIHWCLPEHVDAAVEYCPHKRSAR
ncbi:MAG: uracil-DNA glycosylase [Eubacteriaceae bacterium]|jgi:uracil-DNA glycosylase